MCMCIHAYFLCSEILEQEGRDGESSLGQGKGSHGKPPTIFAQEALSQPSGRFQEVMTFYLTQHTDESSYIKYVLSRLCRNWNAFSPQVSPQRPMQSHMGPVLQNEQQPHELRVLGTEQMPKEMLIREGPAPPYPAQPSHGVELAPGSFQTAGRFIFATQPLTFLHCLHTRSSPQLLLCSSLSKSLCCCRVGSRVTLAKEIRGEDGVLGAQTACVEGIDPCDVTLCLGIY